jgi:hypothetical protein
VRRISIKNALAQAQETNTTIMSMCSKYLHFVQKANYLLFIVVVCMLPFPTHVSLYAWGIWLCSWLLEGRFLCKKNIKWHKGLIPIISLVVLFVWELISYTWAINKTDACNMLIRHISFVAILPIAIWGVNNQYDWRNIARWFIISCIASIFIYGIYIHIFEYRQHILTHHNLPNIAYKWSLFGDKISLIKHRLYYGNILNLGIVALLQIRIQHLSTFRNKKIATAIFFIGLILLVLGIVWSSSRANMLTLLIVSAVAVIQPLRGYTRTLVASLVCVFTIVIGALLFTLHPRFNQLELEHVTERSAFQVNEIEARINIWYSALQEPEDYIWHGVGVGCNSEYLTPVYDSLHWDKFKKRQFNAHNQYLGILINLGIFATLFFFLTWLLLPIWHKGRVRQFATLIALTIGLNMLTENMLDRIDGVIVTSVSMLVIALLSRVQLEK